MNHVQTCTYIALLSLCNVYTMFKHAYMKRNSYISVHTCSDQAYKHTNMYLHACSCTYLFRTCTYQVHTLNVHVNVSVNIKHKSKKLLLTGIEPTIFCIPSSCLNPYASNVLLSMTIVTVYDYCCTWRLVTYVWRGTSRPPRPRPDDAGPSLNMDLFKAEVGGEAGLGA